jgi:hypothetical protein
MLSLLHTGLSKDYAMKASGGVDVKVYVFLPSVLVGETSRPLGKSPAPPPFPLDRRLNGSQSRSRQGEAKILERTGTRSKCQLLLFGETVAVYCRNHTNYINTLCGCNVKCVITRTCFKGFYVCM